MTLRPSAWAIHAQRVVPRRPYQPPCPACTFDEPVIEFSVELDRPVTPLNAAEVPPGCVVRSRMIAAPTIRAARLQNLDKGCSLRSGCAG